MKAIVQDEYGSSEVLRVDDVPVPTIKPHQVLIRVKAAGIDAGVVHLMNGTPLVVRLALGVKKPRQRTIGMDVAGIVESVGADVTGLSVGDEVFGTGTATFAQFAVANAKTVVLKPANVSFAQAAATPISASTALQALRFGRGIRSGDRVLVLGASGGVGHFAVQLAKAAGSHVIGVSSAAKLDFVRELGADDALDYVTTDFADGSRRFDFIVDTGGNRAIADLRRALTRTGTLVIVGGEGGGGPMLQGLDRQLRAGMLSPFVSHKLGGLVSLVTSADLIELARLLAEGTIAPRIDGTVELADVPLAIARFERREVRGKVVMAAEEWR